MKIFNNSSLFSVLIVMMFLFSTNASFAQNVVPPPAPVTEGQMVAPLTPAPISAAPVNPPMAMPVALPPALPNIPTFRPLESWGITKTSLAQARGLQNVKLPCLMTAEFDNGFIVRISGGGGSILAMAIDFRQNIFKQGKQYDSAITTGGMTQTIKARAFAPNVLLFGTREWPGFYAALTQSTDMILDVEGNVFRFMMNDAAGGLSRLEQCFDPNVGTGVMPVMGGTIEPPMIENAPTATNKTPLSNQPNLSRGDLQAGPAGRSTLWQASAGETLDVVLARWGAQAGVDVSWQAGPAIPVQTDFQFRGQFTEAVQVLMAQNAAISGLRANLVGDMAAAAPGGPVPLMPVSTVSSRDQMVAEPRASAARFSAPSGSSLQGVLRLWAEQEGVDFVWQSSQNFALKRGVNASGSFEQAVQSTLEQFINDAGIYPTARLNTDPNTGQRALIVFSSRR